MTRPFRFGLVYDSPEQAVTEAVLGTLQLYDGQPDNLILENDLERVRAERRH